MNPEYILLHGRQSVQLLLGGALIPAGEVSAFRTSLACAQALDDLLKAERKRVRRVLADARRDGAQKGLHHATHQAERKIARTLGLLAQQCDAQQQRTHQALCTLALGIVRKLSMSLGADRVMPALISQAAWELHPLQPTQIRVGRSSFDATAQQLTAAGVAAELRIDDTLGPFDAVIDSEQGQHMAGLELQLQAIAASLASDRPARDGQPPSRPRPPMTSAST